MPCPLCDDTGWKPIEIDGVRRVVRCGCWRQQVWQHHLPGRHLPFSAVEVPFLPVPGCTVQLDLWVYAP